MSMLLSIAFCSTLGQCEEYVVDHNLTRSDCIERMHEERKFLMYAASQRPVEEAYKEYMNSFKAEHMDGEAVDWEINCVKEEK